MAKKKKIKLDPNKLSDQMLEELGIFQLYHIVDELIYGMMDIENDNEKALRLLSEALILIKQATTYSYTYKLED